MDVVSILGGIGSAFGLSASAGLNAYIPLLIVALTARFTNLINLSEPYSVLASWPVIAVLGVLLVVETFADKIPAIDTMNDMVQTLVRPTAGAVLFAANTDVISVNPIMAAIAGVMMAGTVHVTKTAVRPMVTATTVGTGNWVVSILEDIVAIVASLLAIFMPIIIGVVTLLVMIFCVRLYLKRRRKRQLASMG